VTAKDQRAKATALQVPWISTALLNVHAAVYNLFNIDRHLTSRRTMKEFEAKRFGNGGS